MTRQRRLHLMAILIVCMVSLVAGRANAEIKNQIDGGGAGDDQTCVTNCTACDQSCDKNGENCYPICPYTYADGGCGCTYTDNAQSCVNIGTCTYE